MLLAVLISTFLDTNIVIYTEDSTSHVYKTISKWTVGAIARAHVRQKTLGRTCLLFSKSLNYHNFCYSYD